MWIVLVGLMLLLVNTTVGIVVIVLGVMVWTSRKSRQIRGNVNEFVVSGSDVHRDYEVTAAEIVAVRRDRSDIRRN